MIRKVKSLIVRSRYHVAIVLDFIGTNAWIDLKDKLIRYCATNPPLFTLAKAATVKSPHARGTTHANRPCRRRGGAFVSSFSFREDHPDDLERGTVGVPFFTLILWTIKVRLALIALAM